MVNGTNWCLASGVEGRGGEVSDSCITECIINTGFGQSVVSVWSQVECDQCPMLLSIMVPRNGRLVYWVLQLFFCLGRRSQPLFARVGCHVDRPTDNYSLKLYV